MSSGELETTVSHPIVYPPGTDCQNLGGPCYQSEFRSGPNLALSILIFIFVLRNICNFPHRPPSEGSPHCHLGYLLCYALLHLIIV